MLPGGDIKRRQSNPLTSLSLKMGYLHIICGPMFSSKSTYIIELARKYKAIEKRLFLVTHAIDTRYGTNVIASHDGVKETATPLASLSQMIPLRAYKEAEVVIIEEAQFFDDLFSVVRSETDKTGKIYIICGLSGDSQRESIGQILELIPIAEKVEKLNGFCQLCRDGTEGGFTKRLVKRNEKVFIGGSKEYICVCRKHHIE